MNAFLTKNKLFLPCIVTVIATLFMLFSIVLPIAVATDDAMEVLEKTDEEEYATLSILSFSKMYAEVEEDEGRLCLILTVVLAVFSAFALLLAATKHPIGTIIFDILACAVFALFVFFFAQTNAFEEELYNWGFAFYLYIIGAIAAFVGSIWLIVSKVMLKKSAK